MKIILGRQIEEIKKKKSETEKILLKNRNSDELNEVDADDIYFHSNTIKNIKLGSQLVNRIYLNHSIVYDLEDTIDLNLFYSLVPASTASSIIFDKLENQDVSNFNLIGYCDANNNIAVYNNNTEYLVLNMRNAVNYAPASCAKFFYNYSVLEICEFYNFDTSHLISTYQMFYSCNRLKTLNLSTFDFSGLSSTYQMFWECRSLTTINATFNFTASNWFGMFYRCNMLEYVDLSKCTFLQGSGLNNMFLQCRNIKNIIFPSVMPANIICYRSFYQCSLLTTINSTSWNNANGEECFYQCSNLVGGNGTTFNSSNINAEYARVDGENNLPGYFTAPSANNK